jgi:hypothetical protein
MQSRYSFAIQDHLERISYSSTIFMGLSEALKISINNSPPDLVHVKEKTAGCATRKGASLE